MARSARNEIVVISPLALTTSTLCPTSRTPSSARSNRNPNPQFADYSNFPLSRSTASHSHSALSPSSGRTLDCVATTLEEPRVATRPSERAQPRNGEMYSVQDQNHQQRKDDSLGKSLAPSPHLLRPPPTPERDRNRQQNRTFLESPTSPLSPLATSHLLIPATASRYALRYSHHATSEEQREMIN